MTVPCTEPTVAHAAVLRGFGFENAQDRVGVAYIKNKKHGLSFAERTNSSREHSAQTRTSPHPQEAAIVEAFGDPLVAAVFFNQHGARAGERRPLLKMPQDGRTRGSIAFDELAVLAVERF